MIERRQGQRGFTLIEVMVVVVIIAVISGFSVFAVNQSSDRRFVSQAEDLQAWLRQMAEIAMLEGSAYGVRMNGEYLEGLVYHDYRWQRLSSPEPFHFQVPARLTVGEDVRAEESDFPMPEIVMQPDGFMEPRDGIILSFEDFDVDFSYRWNDREMSPSMERSP